MSFIISFVFHIYLHLSRIFVRRAALRRVQQCFTSFIAQEDWVDRREDHRNKAQHLQRAILRSRLHSCSQCCPVISLRRLIHYPRCLHSVFPWCFPHPPDYVTMTPSTPVLFDTFYFPLFVGPVSGGLPSARRPAPPPLAKEPRRCVRE